MNKNLGDNNMMGGIKSHDKYNTTWFYKNSKTTNKPSTVAIETAKKNGHKFIVSRQVENNRLYSSYQTPEDAINTIQKHGNLHLYEMITGDQPVNLFFDIEFPANELDIKTALISLISFTKDIMTETFGNMECFDDEDIYVSGSIGDGKIENVDVRKASYHIVINCNSSFKSMTDLKTFMNYFRFKLDQQNPANMFYMLKGNLKRIVDFQVYGKNQNMKLPNQSKYGSNRVQEPIILNDDLQNHLCGNYEDPEYLDFFDMSKIPDYEPIQKTKTQRSTVGGIRDYVSSGNIHADFVERECIPEDEPVSYKLKYIMNSIDNTDQDYNVWFGIACALKNCANTDKSGLNLFLKWASKSSKFDENECRTLWDRIEKRDKGYNKGTLISLAKRCNPRIQSKKKDFMSPLITTEIKFQTNIYNERWQRPYDLDRYSTIIAQSPMGSGKTTQICEVIKNKGLDMKILVLAPRRCFAKSIATEITKKSGLPFTCYLDIDKKKDLSKEQYLVCQMESIHYLKADYDMIIADEITSCLTQFSSKQTMKGKLILVANSFENIWKNATYKILSDAFINPKVIKFVENFEYIKQPPTIDVAFAGHNPYGHVIFMKNEYIPEERTCIQLPRIKIRKNLYEDNLKNQLIESLKKGKKCVFVVASQLKGKDYINDILRYVPNIKYKFYHSQNNHDVDDLLNVNEAWYGLDLLMYTSTITVGVNFDLEYFDELYMYSSCKSSTVRDNFQSSMRVRYIKDKVMYYQVYTDLFGLGENVVDDIDTVEQIIKNKVSLEDELDKQLADYKERLQWEEMPKWLFDIHVHNVYESNISTLHHEELFDYYLGACGYVHKQCEYGFENIPSGLTPLIFIPYEDIHYTYDDVYELESKQQRERHLFTEYQKLQWQKILFDRQVKEGELRGSIYNFYFDPQFNHKNKYFNCLYEKRYSLVDMTNKERTEQGYKELSGKKALRLQCIKELTHILGIKSSTPLNQKFDKSFLLSKYDDIMDKRAKWLKVFDLRDRSSAKTTKIRQITDTLHMVLEKWSGSWLRKGKRVQKRVNGERVDISTYDLDPPISIDVVGMFT